MSDQPPPRPGNLVIVSEFRDGQRQDVLTTKNEGARSV